MVAAGAGLEMYGFTRFMYKTAMPATRAPDHQPLPDAGRAASAFTPPRRAAAERILGGLYGAGVYFANQSCKAAQYARDPGVKTLLISRVTLGDPFYATGTLSQYRRPPERTSTLKANLNNLYGAMAPGGGIQVTRFGCLYDSVVANSTTNGQVHRELIVYDHRQAYPEYVVRYREAP